MNKQKLNSPFAKEKCLNELILLKKPANHNYGPDQIIEYIVPLKELNKSFRRVYSKSLVQTYAKTHSFLKNDDFLKKTFKKSVNINLNRNLLNRKSNLINFPKKMGKIKDEILHIDKQEGWSNFKMIFLNKKTNDERSKPKKAVTPIISLFSARKKSLPLKNLQIIMNRNRFIYKRYFMDISETIGTSCLPKKLKMPKLKNIILQENSTRKKVEVNKNENSMEVFKKEIDCFLKIDKKENNTKSKQKKVKNFLDFLKEGFIKDKEIILKNFL